MLAQAQFTFTDIMGMTIHCFKWMPDTTPVAVVQIVHGMAEHSQRYKEFAEYLVTQGFAVYSCDLRGHGLTAGTTEKTGHFADHIGWEIASDNIYQLTQIVNNDYPGIPVFLFGHSMGSLLARNYIGKFRDALHGVILSGTSSNPYFLLLFGKIVANIQKLIAGRKHRSQLLDTLSFGSYNSNFKPTRTKFDWLSRDEKEVDKYINDEFCGFVCTTAFFADMLNGILNLQKRSFMAKTPANLPIYIFSGEMDAVGNFTKGPRHAADLYRKYGVKDVELKFYKDGRHEMLNEINKEEVYADILAWLKKKVKTGN